MPGQVGRLQQKLSYVSQGHVALARGVELSIRARIYGSRLTQYYESLSRRDQELTTVCLHSMIA
jgi:hypothetical protein